MKPRHTLAVMMLLVCLSIFGQQPKTVSIQGQPQKTSTQVSTNQQELILQLQAENEAMQKQLENMEKEIELYRGDVRTKISELDEDQSRWTAWICLFVTLITGGLGVALPLYINNRNDKHIKEQLKVATEKAEKAEKALSVTEDLKKQIVDIEKKVNEYNTSAQKVADEAKLSKLFAQAVNEKDKSKAIKLYTQLIEQYPDVAELYYNRGCVKEELNDYEGELKDYDKTIELKADFIDAYFNRGNVKIKLKDLDGAIMDYSKVIELNLQMQRHIIIVEM